MNSIPTQKDEVREFWNAEPCGTRYLEGKEDFDAHARARYVLEPFIFDFAQFQNARGLKVLEIGVGMGADYLEWLKAGAQAAGVDLSAASIERARRRCEQAGYQPDLRVADAEQLPFPDNSFDVVYSYGVMHHSPNTPQCIQEARRVLKPGGQARIMVYHHPSVTGAMLWLRYGILRGKSLRQSVSRSPGESGHENIHSPRSAATAGWIPRRANARGVQPRGFVVAPTIGEISVAGSTAWHGSCFRGHWCGRSGAGRDCFC